MVRCARVFALAAVCLLAACAQPAVRATTPKGPSDKPVAVAQIPYRFTVEPGDEVSIKVWRNDDLNRTVKLDPAGNIQFPLVGEVHVAGLTMSELRDTMTQKLTRYIINPQVDITSSNLRNQNIYILGEIKSPGTQEWRVNMPIWEPIAKAGGFTTDANEENVFVVRMEQGVAVVRAVNLKKVLKGEGEGQDINLQNGDIVYVLPSTIASVARFMDRLTSMITPIVNLEMGIVLFPQAQDVLNGSSSSDSSNVLVPR